MKRNLFILILSCCLLAMAKGETIVNRSNIADEIDLQGDLSLKKLRSVIKPVQAFISDQSIEVDFNATLGTIVISIYDKTGVAVYQ